MLLRAIRLFHVATKKNITAILLVLSTYSKITKITHKNYVSESVTIIDSSNFPSAPYWINAAISAQII